MKFSRKENVRRAIHFQSPEYIPLMYYGTENLDQSDMVMVPVVRIDGGEDGRTFEWNFKWKQDKGGFALGAVDRPPLEAWDELERYKPLDPYAYDRFKEARELMEKYPDRYFIADFVLSGFTIMSFIRGIEDFMADMLEDRENVQRLADIVFTAEEELVRACAAAGFDAIAWGDDLGTQRSMLFSIEAFRDIFKERYKSEIGLAHSLGMDVFMHSCGHIIEVIPELIEVGLDMINLGQPALNGIEALGERFRGKICFACPTGYQTTGVSGSREEIFGEIRQYVERLSCRQGGLLGLVWTEFASLGASAQTQRDILDAWNTYCGQGNPYPKEN